MATSTDTTTTTAAAVRLIAVDFDGTLLTPDDTVTAATVDAISRAQAAGIPVIPATGRPDRLIWDIAAEAGLGPLGVGANGAIILDMATRTIVSDKGFSGPAAVALIDAIRDAVPGVAMAADRGDRFVYEAALVRRLYVPRRQGRVEVADVRDEVGDGCLKLIARREDLSTLDLAAMISPVLRPRSAALAAVAGPHGPAGPASTAGPTSTAGPASTVDTASSNDTALPSSRASAAGMDRDEPDDLAEVTASDIAWVDIGPPGLSKATGLSDVCDRLGLDMSEVAAIGDHYNDLPMLRAVGLPAAMGNAVPDVLAVAQVMPANTDDGVAVFINGILDRR